MSRKILFVVTSNDKLGNTGKKTGYYYSEVSHPWKVITDAGFDVDIVSPLGGQPPYEGFDPNDPIDVEFSNDPVYQEKMKNTLKPEDVKPEEYEAIFYAGGHGVMWDFPDNTTLAEICSKIYTKGGVVSAVCHGPAGLINVKLPNGEYLISGKKINSFTNSEEKAVGMSDIVPFALETKLCDRGALYECSDNFQSHVVVNERLITGQNPMSAKAVGLAILTALGN